MSDCINTDHGYPPCPIITELEAKIERLTSRGIEDMRFTIQELEAENMKLREFRDRVLGWRESDWPMAFCRRTAELIANHARGPTE